MPDFSTASCSTGTIISVSLCTASRAVVLHTYETTATSLTGSPYLLCRLRYSAGYPPRSRSGLRPVRFAHGASQVVLVQVVSSVGFTGWLEPLDRRVVGRELVGP